MSLQNRVKVKLLYSGNEIDTGEAEVIKSFLKWQRVHFEEQISVSEMLKLTKGHLTPVIFINDIALFGFKQVYDYFYKEGLLLI